MAPRPSFSLHLSLDCLFCPLASPPPQKPFLTPATLRGTLSDHSPSYCLRMGWGQSPEL